MLGIEHGYNHWKDNSKDNTEEYLVSREVPFSLQGSEMNKGSIIVMVLLVLMMYSRSGSFGIESTM